MKLYLAVGFSTVKVEYLMHKQPDFPLHVHFTNHRHVMDTTID